MANYAYNPHAFSFSMNPLSFNTTPFTNAVTNLNTVSQGLFNDNPDVALQYMIDQTRPSNDIEALIRRMSPTLRNQWLAEQAAGFGTQQPRSFLDFLSGYNFNQAFANVNPRTRGGNESTFNRPVRWISF